jgi:hypothetical protein
VVRLEALSQYYFGKFGLEFDAEKMGTSIITRYQKLPTSDAGVKKVLKELVKADVCKEL